MTLTLSHPLTPALHSISSLPGDGPERALNAGVSSSGGSKLKLPCPRCLTPGDCIHRGKLGPTRDGPRTLQLVAELLEAEERCRAKTPVAPYLTMDAIREKRQSQSLVLVKVRLNAVRVYALLLLLLLLLLLVL